MSVFGEIEEHINRLIQGKPMYKEGLSLYRDLIPFLKEAEPQVNFAVNDAAISNIKVKEGFPLFSREDLPLDLKATTSLFLRLMEHVSTKNRADKATLQGLVKKISVDSGWIEKFISTFLSNDKKGLEAMAQEANLEPTVLIFLTNMALRPSLVSLKEAVGEKIQGDSWIFGYCPLCGSSPDIAYLDEQGKRFLHCGLCGYEWYYPRLKCPFCENAEQKELGYFVSDEEEGFRVDFCKKCRSYIKTLDMKVIEKAAPLELENLITLHLDLLAHEQGFKTPSA